MAIRLTVKETDRILFCGSKWWGDPDMPEAMEYPMTEDYPLTFVCQINCEDIAKFDPEGKLPHEGMLYFFAALDQWIGYESPLENGIGEWPKGHFVVKYAKEVNFETFRSCIMVDEDDNPITEPEREIEFSECADNADGIKLLGIPFYEEIRAEYTDMISLLQLDEDDGLCMRFNDRGMVNLLMKESDLKFRNWKKTKAHLHSL